MESKKYIILCNHGDYAEGIYNSYDEAVSVAAKLAREDNPYEWEGMDDETVYDYQDGYYKVVELITEKRES